MNRIVSFVFVVLLSFLTYTAFFGSGKSPIVKAESNTYYVSQLGSDENDGSQSNPWLTMQHADFAASDGDTVYVIGSEEGVTYTEGILGGSEDILPSDPSSPSDLSTLYLSKQINWIAVDKVNIASNHAVSGFTMILDTGSKELILDGFTITESIVSSGIFFNEGTVNVNFKNCVLTDIQFLFVGWSASVSLEDCDMTTTNPFLELGTSTVSINGGTYNITASSPIFYGAAVNVNISNADFNITNSGTAQLLSLSGSSSVNIDNSTFGIDNGNADFISMSGAGDLILSNSEFDLPMNNNEVISSTGTGSVELDNNTWNLSGYDGGLPTYFLYDTAETRRNTAEDIIFSDNIVNINSQLGDDLINIAKRNSDITIDGNHIVETDSTVTGAAQAGLFQLTDLVNITFQNNITETIGSESQRHLLINPLDTTWAGGTGTAYVGSNLFKTKSLTGTTLTVGQDGSGGVDFDNKWPGSIVEKNIIYGPSFYNPSSVGNTLHGILIGQNLSSHMRYNYVNGAGYGYVIKGVDWNGEAEGGASDWNHTGGVYGNIAVNNVVNSIANKGVQNLNIYNNTIFNNIANTGGIRVFANHIGEADTYATGCYVYNNIISSNNSVMIKIDDYESPSQQSSTDFQSNNNLFWNNTGATLEFIFDASAANTFSGWQGLSGQDANSIVADPEFIESSMLGLELADEVDIIGQLPSPFEVDAGSPAIYAGHSSILAAGAVDYNGVLFGSTNPTIGALEVVDAAEPDVTILTQTINHANRSVAISGTAIDLISGVSSITINGNSVSLASVPNFSYVLTGLQVGNNDIQLISEDRAGNIFVLSWIVRITALVVEEETETTPSVATTTSVVQAPVALAPVAQAETPSLIETIIPSVPEKVYAGPKSETIPIVSTDNSGDDKSSNAAIIVGISVVVIGVGVGLYKFKNIGNR